MLWTKIIWQHCFLLLLLLCGDLAAGKEGSCALFFARERTVLSSAEVVRFAGYVSHWEAIVVRARASIGYHGVVSSIPSSDLRTLSVVVVGKGEITISIKH